MDHHPCQTPLPTEAIGTAWTCPECGDVWQLQTVDADDGFTSVIEWIRIGEPDD